MLKQYGYCRVGAVNNAVHIADVKYNVEHLIALFKKADQQGVEIVSSPELSLTGYTCQDMFLNDDLYFNVIQGLKNLKDYSTTTDLVFIVGAPLKIKSAYYNCAFTFYHGHILGITPKTFIPNYNEFYEARYFSSSSLLNDKSINLLGEEILISNLLTFTCDNFPLTFAIEICEDLWCANAPSNFTSYNGANVIFNLSASNETIGKVEYRRNLVKMQSAKTLSCYVYASSSINESTSDLLFSGHMMICEPDGTFKENKRFSFDEEIIYADVDIFRINSDRIKQRTYKTNQNVPASPNVSFSLITRENTLTKTYQKMPFLAHSNEGLEEILNIQSYALAKRVKYLHNAKMVIGISGGADSTLAFLVAIRVCDILNLPHSNVIAITMPGFGTSTRTHTNSQTLIEEYGATFKEISIVKAVNQHFEDISHPDSTYDITYENSQARERTQILFDIANQEGGIVIGTGDLSELALGWATYNGDHMSNYAVNCSIPKTLVKTLIGHIRDNEKGLIKQTLTDILNTPISPELLPLDEKGEIKQDTEKSVGPYILHDFFLYHFLRYGASVKKIYYIACLTFKDDFTQEEIKATLKVFVKRFFAQQFKRNCVPDGVKVGSIAVSPRGDLRMSSDTYNDAYLKEVDEL